MCLRCAAPCLCCKLFEALGNKPGMRVKHLLQFLLTCASDCITSDAPVIVSSWYRDWHHATRKRSSPERSCVSYYLERVWETGLSGSLYCCLIGGKNRKWNLLNIPFVSAIQQWDWIEIILLLFFLLKQQFTPKLKFCHLLILNFLSYVEHTHTKCCFEEWWLLKELAVAIDF